MLELSLQVFMHTNRVISFRLAVIQFLLFKFVCWHPQQCSLIIFCYVLEKVHYRSPIFITDVAVYFHAGPWPLKSMHGKVTSAYISTIWNRFKPANFNYFGSFGDITGEIR
jgi:hypothetical protein